MQLIFIYFLKFFKKAKLVIYTPFYQIITYFIFCCNGVKFSTYSCMGIPYVHLSLKASCFIGRNFKMNNGFRYSDSGNNGKCRIEIRDTAVLKIGDNVGISDVTIACHEKISIGNNVLLGVGTHLRDTDNHSLNPEDWLNGLDWVNKKTSPIFIGDNVFIGAYCFILKGVIIGDNSIIGAGSVVTKEVPANQIWAGNPAKFIREI